MSVNEVLEKYGERTRLCTGEVEGTELVLFTGDREAFRFLSELFAAFAEEVDDDADFSISPAGAGYRLFRDSSEKGLYLQLTKE